MFDNLLHAAAQFRYPHPRGMETSEASLFPHQTCSPEEKELLMPCASPGIAVDVCPLQAMGGFVSIRQRSSYRKCPNMSVPVHVHAMAANVSACHRSAISRNSVWMDIVA
jgi:hypothetical protein